MQMHVIATELGADWAGPYTDRKLLQQTLNIIKQIDPGAEVISKDTDPYREQIGAGLRPYHIRGRARKWRAPAPSRRPAHLAACRDGGHPKGHARLHPVFCLGKGREGRPSDTGQAEQSHAKSSPCGGCMSTGPDPENGSKKKGEEPDEAPMGLDPHLSEQLCPGCFAQCLDLAKEQPDEYRQERRWFKCSFCNNIFSIIIGPARIMSPKSDYHELKKAGVI